MKIVSIILASVSIVSVSSAIPVDISGKVVDFYNGAPIVGAAVKLEAGGLTDTTDDLGEFRILGIPVENNTQIQARLQNYAVSLNHGNLTLTLPEIQKVRISAFTLQGKQTFNDEKLLNAGVHTFNGLYTTDGVFIIKIKTGNDETCFKSTSLVRNETWINSSLKKSVPTQAVLPEPMNDYVIVEKSGFLTKRAKISSSLTVNLSVVLLQSAGTVTDIDGNSYQTVRIGTQIWTTENLRTTKLNSGVHLRIKTDPESWNGNGFDMSACYYDNSNDQTINRQYGLLYNWFAVNASGSGTLAPSGWHVPSVDEWNELRDYLIASGYNWDGTTTENKVAKSLAASTDWSDGSGLEGSIGNNLSKNNLSGFSAYPTGYREVVGTFLSKGAWCNWWTSTPNNPNPMATYVYLGAVESALNQNSFDYRGGFSVRLVKDADTMKDVQGNVYHTVKIGNQTWTVENYRCELWSNGTPIEKVTSDSAWGSGTTPKFCYLNNTTNPDSIKKYGALYNWNTINNANFAPSGWHVPDSSEWAELETYLISNKYYIGSASRSVVKALAAKSDWKTTSSQSDSGNVANYKYLNNRTGFSALPAMHRTSNGVFPSLASAGLSTYWWVSNSDLSDAEVNAPEVNIHSSMNSIDMGTINRNLGASVRLIKN